VPPGSLTCREDRHAIADLDCRIVGALADLVPAEAFDAEPRRRGDIADGKADMIDAGGEAIRVAGRGSFLFKSCFCRKG
jgi:hypothetical protein